MRAPAAELLRLVARDGVVLPDKGGHEAGRGAYLHPTTDCFELAERRRAFARALRVEGGLDLSLLRAELGTR